MEPGRPRLARSRCGDPGPRQEGEEPKLPWNGEELDEPRGLGEAPEQGRDERRRRAWRERGSVGGMVDDWRCSGRRTGLGILYPSPACGSALRSNLRARPIAPDLRQEPGAGKPHAGICAGGGENACPYRDSRERINWDADAVVMSGRRNGGARQTRARFRSCVVERPWHVRKLLDRKPGGLDLGLWSASGKPYASPPTSKVGAGCLHRARPVRCGGRSVMGVPTAIFTQSPTLAPTLGRRAAPFRTRIAACEGGEAVKERRGAGRTPDRFGGPQRRQRLSRRLRPD